MKRILIAIIMLCAWLWVFAQSYGEIGTGTVSSNLPSYALWNYAWSEAIYPAASFGVARTITKLAFNHINSTNVTMPNQKIFLKESPAATFANNNYDEPTSNGFTQVFNGSLTTVTGWTEIDITDFNYSGTGNLIVLWENRSGVSNYNTNWYSTDCNSGVIKCSGSDTSFPTTAGFAPWPLALPNLRYYYSSNDPATPANPNPATGASGVSLNASFGFTLGSNTAGYQVLLGTSPTQLTPLPYTAVNGAGNYQYTPTTPLQANTTYYWQVKALNGNAFSLSPVWNFSTEGLVTTFPYSQSFEETMFPPQGWIANSTAWSRALYPNTGEACAKVNYYHTDHASLRTPRIQLPANPVRVHFYWADCDDLPDRIVQHDSTYFEISANLGQSWTVLGVLSAPSYQNAYNQFVVDLNQYAGQTVYLRWRDVTDGSLYAYGALLDDLLIEEISSNAVISLSASSYSFPEIGVNTTSNHSISISNLGSSPLSFSGVTAVGPFSCPTPPTINPSQTVSVPITFSPVSAGVLNGSLSFNINGTFSGNNTINLSGSAYNMYSSLFQNFDESTAMPTHWSSIVEASNQYSGVFVKTSSFDAYSGSNFIKIFNSAEDTLNVELILVSPALTNLSANSLSFYAKSSWGVATDTMILGYMTDPTNADTFTAVQTLNLTENYQHFSYNFAPSVTAHFIAFKHGLGGGENYAVYLDDIGWEVQGGTPNPATAVYPSNTANNIRIDYVGKKLITKMQWSSGGGDPTGYKLYFGTNGSFNMVNNQDLGLIGDLAFDQALNYNTTYNWKLVPYNANGEAANCPVWTFTTMPDPTVTITSASSYNEGFEGTAVGDIPLGFELDNLDNDTAYWTTIANSTSSQNAHSGTKAVHMGFSFMTVHNDWMYLPPMELNGGQSYRVSFWYKSIEFPGDPCVEKLELKWGLLPTPEAMTNSLFYNDNIVSPTAYTNAVANIVPPADGVYFLGFRCFSDPMQFILLVDDINISTTTANNDENSPVLHTELLPAYPNPFNPEINLAYSLAAPKHVSMEVYNVKGQRVRVLQNSVMDAGSHKVVWNGKDDSAQSLSSGVYFVKFRAGEYSNTQKIVMMK